MQAQGSGTGHGAGGDGQRGAALTPGRAALITLTVLGILLVAVILVKIQDILIVFLIGLLLATAIEPLVNRLQQRGLGRGQAILTVFGLLFIIVGALVAILVPTIFGELSRFFTTAPKLISDLRQSVETSQSTLIRENGPFLLDEIEKRIAQADIPTERALTMATYLPSIFGNIIQGLIRVVTTLMVVFYWLTEKTTIKRVFLSFFTSEERQNRAQTIWDDIETKLGGWLRGQLILMGLVGTVVSIGYGLMGVKFALLLGVLAGLCEMIPIFGPWISGTPAVLLALTQSWRLALGVIAFIFLLQMIEGNVMVPRVMKGSIGLSPLLVVLAVLVAVRLLGPTGGIIAIPLAAVLQVLISDLVRGHQEAPDLQAQGARAKVFRWRSSGLPRRLRNVEPGPAVVSTFVELNAPPAEPPANVLSPES